MKRGTFKPVRKPRTSAFSVLGVRHYPDGREVCDKTTAGKLEYKRRVEVMWKRQHGICGLRISPLCPVYVQLKDATFEHVDGRGMGGAKRTDVVEIDGRPYNLMSCKFCNAAKGSRSLEAVRPAGTNPPLTTEETT